MKFCSNCGAKLEPGDKFCTNCGADLSKLAGENSAPTESKETPSSTQTAAQADNSTQSQPEPAQPSQSVDYANEIKSAASQASQKVATAVKNFDKESLWKWLVTSWKHPLAQQHGEKWYGIASLVVEFVLYAFSLFLGTNMLVSTTTLSQASYDRAVAWVPELADTAKSFNHASIWYLLLFAAILMVVMVFASLYTYKFVYGTKPDIYEHINRMAQISNYALILTALSFVTSLINRGKSDTFVYLMGCMSLLLIFAAGIVILMKGQNPTKNVYAGVAIYAVITIVLAFIFIALWGQKEDTLLEDVKSQYQDRLSEYFGNLFN